MEPDQDCFMNSCESFAWYDHDTSCWRMLLPSSTKDLILYLGRWPKQGMTVNGLASKQATWAPATSAIGGGALPTPATQEHKRRGPNSKQQKLSNTENWLPTPCASNAKEVGPRGSASQIHNEQNGNLCGVIKGLPSVPTGAPMYLNPSFVEEMMGFPVGWTDLKRSEMQLSLMSL